MALTLTNTTLTNPADKAEIEANFTDVVNKFDGNIVNADINASAGIATSKLASDDYELDFTFMVSAAQAAFASVPVAAIPIPSINGRTLTGVSGGWYITADGTANTFVFKVEFGYLSGTAWTDPDTIVASTTITSSGGNTPQVGTFTPNDLVGDANTRMLGLFVTTSGLTGPTTGSQVTINLRFKHALV